MHEMKAKGAKEMIIGYARVSTDGQSVVAQQSALKAAGA
jgi:DNA invertase Pin-like site-specific DNA recombinase